MNVVAALVSCIATGAMFASLCAALVVPIFAWLAIRSLAPAIHRMDGDWRAQAAFAAWAASAPGALFIFLVAYGVATSVSSPCLQTIPGRILFGALAGVMLAAIASAITHAFHRRGEAERMCRSAIVGSPRLARISASAGVIAYEIPDDAQSIVMLCGDRSPAVYVSSKALRDLGDEELLAAMYHERAHQTRADHRIAPLLYFLTDLLPLPVADLVKTYRRSREFCADQYAVQHVAASDLASALLQMVSPQNTSPVHAAAFAEPAVLRDRLRAILLGGLPAPNYLRRVVVTAGLSAILAVGAAVPPIATLVVHCAKMGSM